MTAKSFKAPPGECPCCGKVLRRYWLLENGVRIATVFRVHTAPCGLSCTPDKDPELHRRDCPECSAITNPPPSAECPCCGKDTGRIRTVRGDGSVGLKFKEHKAPCGLPCKLPSEARHGERTHVVTDECARCLAMQKILFNGQVVNKVDLRPPDPIEIAPPTAKVPWNQIVIPPHVIKMVMLRAGFNSAVAAATLIEQFYPLTVYRSSQKEAQGTSHTKRSKPGKNKHLSPRVDLYVVTHQGVEWTFFMKRNVLMTVHRNDDFDYIGPPPGKEVVLDPGA